MNEILNMILFDILENLISLLSLMSIDCAPSTYMSENINHFISHEEHENLYSGFNYINIKNLVC